MREGEGVAAKVLMDLGATGDQIAADLAAHPGTDADDVTVPE